MGLLFTFRVDAHQVCQLSHAIAHLHMQVCMLYALVVHVHTTLCKRYLQITVASISSWVLLTETD